MLDIPETNFKMPSMIRVSFVGDNTLTVEELVCVVTVIMSVCCSESPAESVVDCVPGETAHVTSRSTQHCTVIHLHPPACLLSHRTIISFIHSFSSPGSLLTTPENLEISGIVLTL